MSEIIGFAVASAQISKIVRLKLTSVNNFVVGGTITTSGGFAGVIDSINADTNDLKVSVTGSTYVDIGDTVTDGGTGTGTALPCEATFFKMAQDAAKEWIQDITGQLWGSTAPRTEKFTTKLGDRYFVLEKAPMVSVDSITLDGSSQTEDSTYWVDLEAREIDFGYTRISESLNPENLSITYTHGNATIKSNVLMAAAMFIERFWRIRNKDDSLKGAESLSFGGRSVRYAEPPSDAEIYSITADIRNLLASVSKMKLG